MSEDDLHQIAVKDFAYRGIAPKVTCRNCGRERIIGGGLLVRHFAPDGCIHPYALNQFARRLRCGNCNAPWPKLELVIVSPS